MIMYKRINITLAFLLAICLAFVAPVYAFSQQSSTTGINFNINLDSYQVQFSNPYNPYDDAVIWNVAAGISIELPSNSWPGSAEFGQSRPSIGFTHPEGYLFAGWIRGDIEYNALDSVEINYNTAFAARWTAQIVPPQPPWGGGPDVVDPPYEGAAQEPGAGGVLPAPLPQPTQPIQPGEPAEPEAGDSGLFEPYGEANYEDEEEPGFGYDSEDLLENYQDTESEEDNQALASIPPGINPITGDDMNILYFVLSIIGTIASAFAVFLLYKRKSNKDIS